MSHNTTMIAFYLILVTTITSYGLSEDKKQIELKLFVYPETIAFGDTCYVLVSATNHSDEIAGVLIPTFSNFNCVNYDDVVQFDLNHRGEIWCGAFECESDPFSFRGTRALFDNVFTFTSGETIIFLAVPLQFPSFEDLHQDDFWKKKRKELENNLEGLAFEFGIEFANPGVSATEDIRARLTKKLTITLRNDKEMELIDQWYRDTPNDLFPQLGEVKIYFDRGRIYSVNEIKKRNTPPLFEEKAGEVKTLFKFVPLSANLTSQKKILGYSLRYSNCKRPRFPGSDIAYRASGKKTNTGNGPDYQNLLKFLESLVI